MSENTRTLWGLLNEVENSGKNISWHLDGANLDVKTAQAVADALQQLNDTVDSLRSAVISQNELRKLR